MQLLPDIVFIRSLQRWSRYFAILALLIPLMVLLGWEFDISRFRSPFPQFSGMNPVTAVLFLLSVTAYFILRRPGGSLQRKITGNILAFLVFLGGTVKILSLIPGFDLEIDLLLFRNKIQNGVAEGFSSQIGLNSAVCFILTGLSLFLLPVETARRRMPSQYLALLINLAALFSLMGYFYQVKSFYGVFAYLPMAIYSAICFVFLSLALLFTHPDSGFMKEFTSTHTGSITARTLIPTAVLLPVALGFIRLYGTWAQWYSNEFGVVVFTLSLIIIFIAIIGYNSFLLNRRDAQKLQTEKALRESEEQIQAIFKGAPDSVVVIDEKGHVIQWNRQSETLFGWTAEEVRGKLLGETLIPPRYREAHKKGLERFVKTGHSNLMNNTVELKALRKDNTELDIALSIAGTIVQGNHFFIGFIRDITQQKKMEGQLKRFNEELAEQVKIKTTEIRQNEEKYRTLVEQASDGIFITDPNGNYVEVNGRGCQLTGYSREELLQKHLMDLVVLDEEYVPLRVDELKAGRSVVQSRKLRKKDGSIFFAEISAKQLPDGRLLGFVRDITERTKAEKKLAESEKNLRDVLTSSADSFYVIDRDCRVTLINEAAARNLEIAWGKPVGIGTNILELIPDEETEPIRESLEKVFSGEPVEYELEVDLPGIAPWWLITYMPVRGTNQEVIGAYIATKNITERKKAEELFRYSNERFELISRTTNDAVWDWNLETNELWANETHQYLYGLAPEDPVPSEKMWEERIHPDDRERLVNLQKAALASTSNVFISEYRFHTEKEGYKTLYDRCYIIRGKNGKPLRMTGSMMDITERKRAEEEIKRSREQLLASIENTPNVAVQWYNEQGEVLFWNRASETIFGWTADEAIGKTLDQLIYTREETAEFVKTLQQIRKDGKPVGPVGFSFSHRDGSPRVCLSTLFSIPSATNMPCFVCMDVDITEQKKAEEALRESEERYRALVENATEALVVLDMEKGKFVNVSMSAERLFKMSREELLNKGPLELSPPYQADGRPSTESAMEKLDKAIAGEKPFFEWIHLDREGNQVPCEIWLVRLPSEDKVLIRGSIVDISERKKAEKELNASYAAIRKLTGYLQNIREEERTHIAREIHDELGQQLTVLKMDASWIQKRMSDKEPAVQERIKELIKMLDQTVRSVRRISSQLRPSLLDDLGLVAAMEWYLKEFEQRSGIHTRLMAAESGQQLPDDVKTGLFRIFQESLTNVARHADARKVEVVLQTGEKDFLLRIEDDGKGFDKKTADSKRTLGILGMRERTHMMGGSYDIETVPGKGTTILVTIPNNGNLLNGQ